GDTGSGLYRIQPEASGQVDVYCEMQTDGGGWTRIGHFNQATTSYSSAPSNTAPTTNWQMPPALVKNFNQAEKLVKFPTLSAWTRFPNVGSAVVATAGSYSAHPTTQLSYRWSHPS